MSKYFALGAVILIVVVISAAYITGLSEGKRIMELENLKADQAQLDENREIKNAVEKLDDTGLRNAINGLRTRKD